MWKAVFPGGGSGLLPDPAETSERTGAQGPWQICGMGAGVPDKCCQRMVGVARWGDSDGLFGNLTAVQTVRVKYVSGVWGQEDFVSCNGRQLGKVYV